MGTSTSRQLQPISAQRKILRYPIAGLIGQSQPQLGWRRTRVSSTLIGSKCLCRTCLASKHQQGVRLLLGGSLLKPALGNIGALVYPRPLLVTQPELVLSVTIALLGRFFQPFDGLCIDT